MKMSEEKRSTRGRKRTLTDSARKRHRSLVVSKYNQGRIAIGEQYDRWMELKETLQLKSHADVAEYLLDRNENLAVENSAKKMKIQLNAKTSTPGPRATIFSPNFSDVSEISSDQEKKDRNSDLSGVEEFNRIDKIQKTLNSFLNPSDLSICWTENFTSEDSEDSSDEEYEPSYIMTIREDIQTDAMIEESEDEEGFDEESLDFDVQPGPGVSKILSQEDVEDAKEDQPFIVYLSQILTLAKMHYLQNCQIKSCNKQVSVEKAIVGSALYLKWVCAEGHQVQQWCSQPVLNRGMHLGDLMLSSSILLSGSNFQKVSMMAKFMKFPFISKNSFYKIQRTYLIPAVDEFWTEHQETVFDQFRGRDIVILGDGRMDSPGHTAQYCSYTFMEYDTKTILYILTMDKRATEKKSTNLEKACFVQGLRFLLDEGLRIVEVVTDAHVQVASVMKKDFPNIRHSFDIWHGTKNLGKKIIKVGQEKSKKDLLSWTKDVVNHYWFTASISNTKEEFIGNWIGILHHTVNVHSWVLSYSNINECSHGPLTEELTKGWLEKDSPAHVALREIVLDKRLQNNVTYYLNCRSTAELENFQNLVNAYASKRHSYNPPTYRCRNRLAALDHNHHINRNILVKKDGSTQFQRSYNKKSGRWAVHPVKEKKAFEYMPSLLKKILLSRVSDEMGMNQPVVLEADDPRRLSSHLAPLPPPPTDQLALEQKSRFIK